MNTSNDFTGFTTLKDLRIGDDRPTVINLMRQQLIFMSTLSKAANIEIFVRDRLEESGREIVVTMRGDLFWAWQITSKILATIPLDQTREIIETQCTKALVLFLKPFDDYWWETLNENQPNGAPT